MLIWGCSVMTCLNDLSVAIIKCLDQRQLKGGKGDLVHFTIPGATIPSWWGASGRSRRLMMEVTK